MHLNNCRQLDQQDELAEFKTEFLIPDNFIYLDGNSLGPLMRCVNERISHTVSKEWGQDLITSWNDNDWINLPVTTGEKIARLIGAAPGQVICSDSVSINLFKILASALALRPDRNIILSTSDNFPTDLYMAQGLASLDGNRSKLVISEPAELLDSLSDAVTVLMLTEVNFRTGERWNIKTVNEAAHEAGALVIWDLSHSVGALPVDLDGCEADFAIGCGYKYLNGGPGAPAFLYVAERHQHVSQPLAGWMGHAQPFAFNPVYEPMPGIRRFLSGTPGIIGMSALDAAMQVWNKTTPQAVQQKSISLANVVRERVKDESVFSVLEPIGPGPGPAGGSQVSLRHESAYEIVQALIERGVIGDFRNPDIIRFGLCPLFLSHEDVYQAMDHLAEVLDSREYDDPRFKTRSFVT